MVPTALAELGLIDEHQFVVHTRVAGRGPTLLAGLSRSLDLALVGRFTVMPGVLASRYIPARSRRGHRSGHRYARPRAIYPVPAIGDGLGRGTMGLLSRLTCHELSVCLTVDCVGSRPLSTVFVGLVERL